MRGFFTQPAGYDKGILSLALFVLAADYLSRGLDRLFAAHLTMFYQAPGLIRISHLAYADDLMIFTTTCRQNMCLILRRMSGLGNDESLPWREAGLDSKCVGGHSVASASGDSPAQVSLIIERIFNFFVHGRKHIHCSSWANACFPVVESGLGVRSLADYVWAFSMKLWWRFSKSEYFHGRYCRNLHSTIVPYNRNHSLVWHRVCRIRDVAEPFLFWTLGEGPAQGYVYYGAAGQGDKIVWTGSSTGDFSRKSALEAIRQASPGGSYLQMSGTRNVAKYRGVPFSTDGIILQVQRHLRTLYATRTLTSTQWKGDLHQAAVMGFIFRQQVSRAPSIVHLRAPSPSWFKLNTDGSTLGNPGLAGVAGIIWDSAGHVHLAYQFALGIGTSVLAELTAVWRGMELALTHGLAPLVVEVDAMTVISLLKSRASGKWEVQHLIMQIVCLQQLLVADVQHVLERRMVQLTILRRKLLLYS
ncbi:UNVERIFIED_CONTAM: putative ribonuclease H protein [Sesamum calycinum]|uniref:Ribonuclease H protein n=1 Tax=Sesamum calycinum TaxID=2727403 RepID=A0AAW2SGG7_9LAMI